MQLALPPEVLVLIGAAALVLVVASVVALVVRRRRRPGPEIPPEIPDAPVAAADPAWQPPPADAAPTRTVASAVAKALAAREAAGVRPAVRGDARDRLLAVLLEDPVRAVGAAADLESCRRQLDRLAGALDHERATLRDVVARLTAAGLAPDQIARLSGPELQGLLPERASTN